MSATLTERYDSVLLVTLNRPEVLNAVDGSMVEAMAAAWRVASDPDVRAVVVTGAGRGFCAGADLKSSRPSNGELATAGLRHTYNPVMSTLAALDKPVIAAVNGATAGFGVSIACAADIRIAARNASFVPAFVDIGLVPDGGGTYFITRLLGYAAAFEWLTSGRRLSAEDALARGLVGEVVPEDDLVPRALQVATTVADKPGRAVALTKQLLAQAARAHLAEQLDEEARAQEAALAAPGRAEARADVAGKLGR